MSLNFRHLQYFWATAHAGGIVKAGERLHTTPQTLSGQIKLLEERFGRKLLRKRGRNLELTEDGRVALRYADEIFALGGALESALQARQSAGRLLEFRVGIADSVAKSVAYHLLEPALQMAEPLRLVCAEGKFDELLAQLALHRLDLVISDEPLSRRVSVKAYNHSLGRSPTSFFASPSLAARLDAGFPQCLNGAPMLLQGASSSLRQQFDPWLMRYGLAPAIVGEFDDGALTLAFGRQGRGVFMSPSVLEDEVRQQTQALVIGRSDELIDEYFAISVERRIRHPGVAAITEAAQREWRGISQPASDAGARDRDNRDTDL